MPDRDMIIRGCEYWIKNHKGEQLILEYTAVEDLLALLKEKEAEWIYGENKTGVDGWHCSYCGFFEPWFYEFTDDIDFIRFYSFCPGCGRRMTSYTGKQTFEQCKAVKWNERR